MQFRFCTSLSLNEKEYEAFKATEKGVKEVFKLGLQKFFESRSMVPLKPKEQHDKVI